MARVEHEDRNVSTESEIHPERKRIEMTQVPLDSAIGNVRKAVGDFCW
jgi:hypothetical protein